MSHITRTILVVGATGRQGGAVISNLLPKTTPSSIKALTRNPWSSSAQKLISKGITAVQGDLSQPSSLAHALAGVHSLYFVTDHKNLQGADGELVQATSLIQEAKSAGVQHIVFSSVEGAQFDSGVPHWESKSKIEDVLKSSGIQWTILRPVGFMENFPVEPGAARFATLSMFKTGTAGKAIQVVAVEDIGFFAADALLNPETYAGQTISIAGDEISVDEMAKAYGKVQGSDNWKAPALSFELSALPEEFQKMFKFYKRYESDIDIMALRKRHPQMLSFEDWLRSKSM